MFTVFAKKSDTTRRHFDLYDPETGESVDCWLDLRTELSGAELEGLSLVSAMNSLDDTGLRVDFVALKMKRVQAWVTGWRFGAGYSPPVDETSIAALRAPVMETIDGIVLEHATEAARKAAPLADPKLALSPGTKKGDSKTRARKPCAPGSGEPTDSDG